MRRARVQFDDDDEEAGFLLIWLFSDGRGWPALIATLAGLTLLAYHYFHCTT